MAQTNAERQRAWRLRHRDKPRGNAAMMAQLVALQARVAQLEAELAATPPARSRAPSGKLLEAFLAVRQERDELAVLLAQIEAYQPGITEKAAARIAQVDAPAQALTYRQKFRYTQLHKSTFPHSRTDGYSDSARAHV